jgi:viroplasmin and RNaseH domain-containing protein
MARRIINRISNVTAKDCIEILEICASNIKELIIKYKDSNDIEVKKAIATELRVYNETTSIATQIMKSDSEMSLKASQERVTELNADQIAKDLINNKKQDNKKIVINVSRDS